ncbi:nucleotidyltransferase [Aquimarina sp. TRL1]|uniref:nucleotidyltransferase n=1 Tax=Aquimarina sp. (strain TRL1) TaxID=2736252 RepID=UPI00158CAAFB|nr:nucleotidyltransferase [Aquimarina sp. TRL1]QKX04894.1 nucleotidyltransferase [Aquimarina sp. TRL1]
MARKIKEIQQQMLSELSRTKELNALETLIDSELNSLVELTSTSKVAIWRLFLYVVAVSIWTIEKSFDLLKEQVLDLIYRLRPHTPSWYRDKTLLFQYGHALKPERDYYDNKNLTTAQIIKSKVVKYAAVVEISSRLYIKVAGEKDGERIMLPTEQVQALQHYLSLIRDAGVKIKIINRPADLLALHIDAYYDPSLLDTQGARIDGSDNEPLQNGIKEYLKKFEFNGEMVLTKLVNHLEKIKGIKMPVIKYAAYKYGNNPTWTKIDEIYQTDAGHMKIEELKINWIKRDV